LNVQDITLFVGATDKLTATVSPENVTDPVITWSSDNDIIATVDTDGNVTAVAVGVANITAKCGDVTATCKVTVNPVPASSVTLNVQDITLLVGATDKLTATISPENVTNPVIIWSSDNESIATVDAEGNVTAVAVGVANITATCGNVSATCKVTVESLVVRPEAPTQMLRKGNGTSCTFIAMMAMTDTEIEQEGYSFVYGYTDATGNDNVIAKTNVRYCHTTPAIYNNSANDFWVFTVRVDDNGEMIGSERRHLDGSVDDDYDLSSLLGRSRGIDGSDPDNWITATSRGALITVESADAVVVTVCSLGGQVVMRQETAAGTMVSQEINGDIITPDIYVIRVDCGGKNVSKKVIIR
ncbi:MAG: Ig-like domain-containing protein, partial [Duncaniella sp.]|nr:Ig-like domain-containing protein [Duncaniella sp.]